MLVNRRNQKIKSSLFWLTLVGVSTFSLTSKESLFEDFTNNFLIDKYRFPLLSKIEIDLYSVFYSVADLVYSACSVFA